MDHCTMDVTDPKGKSYKYCERCRKYTYKAVEALRCPIEGPCVPYDHPTTDRAGIHGSRTLWARKGGHA